MAVLAVWTPVDLPALIGPQRTRRNTRAARANDPHPVRRWVIFNNRPNFSETNPTQGNK